MTIDNATFAGKLRLDPSSRCLPPPIPTVLQFQPHSPFEHLVPPSPTDFIAGTNKATASASNKTIMNARDIKIEASNLFSQGKLLQSEAEAEQALHLLCCTAH